MNLMDLSGTIEMAVKAYIDSPNCNCRTAQDINNGLCMDFAEYVVDKCGGPSDILFPIDETSFYVDTPEEAEENGWDDVLRTNEGGCWNKQMLDQYGYPQGGIDNFHPGFHGWIINEGKHYDAETPHGVDTPWELPCFQRMRSSK